MCNEVSPTGTPCTKPLPFCYGYHANIVSGEMWKAPDPPRQAQTGKKRHERITAASSRLLVEERTGPPENQSPKHYILTKVVHNTPEAYKAAFEQEVKRLAGLKQPFTSEDVTAVVGQPSDADGTPRPNRVGALMRSFATKYGCSVVNYTDAKRSNQNGTKIGQWMPV